MSVCNCLVDTSRDCPVHPGGETVPDFLKAFPLPWTYDSCGSSIRAANGEMVADVRGWGYLTGAGGLSLPEAEAVAIQDAVGEFIVRAALKAAGVGT